MLLVMKGAAAKMFWALALALASWQVSMAQNVIVDGEPGLVSGSLPDGTGAPTPPPVAPAAVPAPIAEDVPGVSFQPAALAPAPPGAPKPKALAAAPVFPPVPPPPRQKVQGHLFHLCGCSNTKFDFEPTKVQQMRSTLSDKFSTGGGVALSTVTWSDHIWTFGQFLDHDIVATVDLFATKPFPVKMVSGQRQAIMNLTRVQADPEAGKPQCRAPTTIQTPLVDASMIYGTDPMYLKNTLRLPNSCMLRTSAGDFVPVTTRADNKCIHGKPEIGCNKFVAGDVRVNENAALTGLHVAFLREHNRLCATLKNSPKTNDEKFEIVRATIIAKLHQITVKEFLPIIASLPEQELRAWKPLAQKPDISVEFDIAYRLGHDLISNKVGRFGLKELFGAEAFYGINSDAGSGNPDQANTRLTQLMQDARTFRAGEADGKFSDALRNILFGQFGQDLFTHNAFRSAEMGMQPYSVLTKCFGTRPVPAVVQRLKAARTDNPAFALFQETGQQGNGFVGPLVHTIVKDQFHRLFFGKGGFWWEDNLKAVGPFQSEIRSTTLGKIFKAAFGGNTWQGNIFIGASD